MKRSIVSAALGLVNVSFAFCLHCNFTVVSLTGFSGSIWSGSILCYYILIGQWFIAEKNILWKGNDLKWPHIRLLWNSFAGSEKLWRASFLQMITRVGRRTQTRCQCFFLFLKKDQKCLFLLLFFHPTIIQTDMFLCRFWSELENELEPQ